MEAREHEKLLGAFRDLDRNELALLSAAIARLEESAGLELIEKVKQVKQAFNALAAKLWQIWFGAALDADWTLSRLHEKANRACEFYSQYEEESTSCRAISETWREVLDFIETYYFEAGD